MKIKFTFENMWLWDTTTIRVIPEIVLSHLYLKNKWSQKRDILHNPEFYINWLGLQFGIKVVLV
jgi:hypothetical protein